jgi:hypothetical protein
VFGRLGIPGRDEVERSVQDNRNDLRSFNDPAASVGVPITIEKRNVDNVDTKRVSHPSE